MSLSTRERQARIDNPFEIFGPGRAYSPVHAARHSQRSVVSNRPLSTPPVPQRKPAMRPIPVPGRLNARKRSPVSFKSLAGFLILLLVVFSLLPSPLQKRCYALLGWKQASGQQASPLPVAYAYISSPFGIRWGRPHQGIDFAAPHSAPIYASSAGTVVYSGWESGYGKSVVIDHGSGIKTRYAHCSKLLVPVGRVVSKGALIAKVGSTGHSTGPHLHFEVIVNGIRKNPAWYYAFQRYGTEQVVQAAH